MNLVYRDNLRNHTGPVEPLVLCVPLCGAACSFVHTDCRMEDPRHPLAASVSAEA